MSAFVRFWGTRGSIPTPGHKTRRYGGNTSCVAVRFDDLLFVCDGGTGLRELGQTLMEQHGDEPLEAHLFFSHTHWDHIQGFPFFMPAYSEKNRMFVYDATHEDDRIHRLLLGQMRSEYFPVTFSDLGSKIISRNLDSGATVIEGVTVRHMEQTHPGRSFAYSFEKDGVKVVYATDSELDLDLVNKAEAERNRDALRVLPPELVRFAEGANLLIADGQYTDDEYPEKVGWGHARATTVADFAHQAGVRQVALFHHDPMHSDDDVEATVAVCQDRARRAHSPSKVFAAREGLELRLD
ncbi:MAG: MBL fold metallo-hydrolase [Myxococcales bacterium]|nr:MBL fold metallo-hydrolase [Myxococcales bacterium]MCB9575925.1 MBL fold metallo-hydrolase [Polyangiaceae bacterium]